jgi:dihydroorotase
MRRLVLRGGRVLDPASGIDGGFDVVIGDSRILELAPAGSRVPDSGEAGDGDDVQDVAGLLVVPGLVDLHGHWFEGSPYGIGPAINLAGGVTLAIDAGTAGFSNFAVFRRLAIDGAPVTVRAFLHIAAAGLVSTLVGELEDIRYARPRETATVVEANRDVIVGVKVRIGSGACGPNGSAALSAALEAAERAGVPLMTHIADGADVREVFERLRPGDVVTHALTASGDGIRAEDGRLRPEVHASRRRGVRLDVGHGCGSFSWATARAALAEGVAPDTISTDLHRYSVERPVVDLPLTMSKLLHLGMSLPEVIAAATSTPASIVDLSEHGRLRVGGRADIAVLRFDDQPAELADSDGVSETVARTLRPVLSIVAGVVHRATEVEVPLRPYLDADHEVDCSVPI